ncbi:MAG TPA: flagellar hook-length control protein FliK [Stellaceae bacterium]|nr:flagellar hook-length control protein FliK [Stellaceae bacterium]
MPETSPPAGASAATIVSSPVAVMTSNGATTVATADRAQDFSGNHAVWRLPSLDAAVGAPKSAPEMNVADSFGAATDTSQNLPSNEISSEPSALARLSLMPVASTQLSAASVAFGDAISPPARAASVTPADTATATSAAASLSANSAPAADPTASAAASPSPRADLTATNAGVADQVADHLIRLVSSNTREMVVRLRPPELGDVTVRVAVNGHDVSAWFVAPQPQVQNAITAAMDQLQTSLGSAGYNLNGAWVGGDGSGAQQQQSGWPQPLMAASSPVSTASAQTIAPAAPRPGASELNIYV